MNDADKLAGHPTQAEVAAHLSMSDRTVRELEKRLTLSESYTLAEFRLAYIRHLREQAAGRMGDGEGLDLVQERAALARSQREAQDLKNAVARGQFAPVGLLADVLGKASSGVVDRMEQIDGQLRKACPDLPENARTAVLQMLADARNEWIRATAKLVADSVDELGVADEAGLDDTEAERMVADD